MTILVHELAHSVKLPIIYMCIALKGIGQTGLQ